MFIFRKLNLNEATKDIKMVLVCPAPGGNWYQLLVQGDGIKAAEPEIKQLETKYPQWTLTVSDMKPVFQTADKLPVYTVPFRESPFYLTINKGYDDQKADCSVATIGGFLCDDNDERCFAFSAAHALVPGQESGALKDLFGEWEKMRDHIHSMRRRITGEHSSNELVIHNHNHLHKMTASKIQFGAQEYVKPSVTVENYRKFAIDFLLLQVPPTKVYREPVQKKPLQFMNRFQGKHSLGALPMEHAPGEFYVTRFVDITSKEDIDRLRERSVAVFVDGHIGTIEAPPEVLPGRTDFVFGWHIPFKTDTA